MSFLLCIYSICCNRLIIKLYYPHSKCGERVTAPWVRIPVSPLNVLDRNGQQTDKKLQINDLWLFLLPESPASKRCKGMHSHNLLPNIA